ncbi:Ubiquitin C-terminal hydrolase 12 [Linum perenne]
METKKFQWKIPNFSKLNDSRIYSDTFQAGGCRWKVRTYPRGYRQIHDYLPLFLICCSDPDVKPEVRSIEAEYSFTLVDQINGRSFTKRGSKRNFKIGEARGFSSFIAYKNLFNPIEGFFVNDAIIIEAQVSPVSKNLTREPAVNAADKQPVENEMVDSKPRRMNSQSAKNPVTVTETEEFGKCPARKTGIKRSRMKEVETEWKIPRFSKYAAVKSNTLLSGGCEWCVVSKLKRYDHEDYLSLFLRCCSDMGGQGSWQRRRRYAEYSLTLVDQINDVNSITRGGEQNFMIGDVGWGYKQFIPLEELFDPDKGLVVDDTVLIDEGMLTDSDSDYDHQPSRTSIRRTTMNKRFSCKSERATQDASERIESTSTRLKSRQQDPIIILSSDSDSDGPNDNEHETDRQPDRRPSVRKVKLEQLSPRRNAADQEAAERVQTTPPLLNPKAEGCPDFSGLTSTKLIAELSTVTINSKSPLVNGSALLLEQQRAKMARYLNMSLESLHKFNSFEDVERIALLIADKDPKVEVNKEILKGLLSDVKQGVPISMSAIETSRVVEASMAKMMEELDGRLNYRQEQMRALEVEVSRLGKEEKDLEVEIQQLTARKGRVGDRMRSTSVELGKVSEEASRELDEVKEHSKKRKLACEDRLIAEEKLAKMNTSWKDLKQLLRL